MNSPAAAHTCRQLLPDPSTRFALLSLPRPPLSEPQFPHYGAQSLTQSPHWEWEWGGGRGQSTGCECCRSCVQRGLQQVQLCSLGTGRLPRANLYQRAIIHFFIFLNLRTTAFLSNSQPYEFCFLCSSRSMASAQALLSFPHGAPDRDINLGYPEAFPSRYQDCTRWLFVWFAVLLPSLSSHLQKLASLPS